MKEKKEKVVNLNILGKSGIIIISKLLININSGTCQKEKQEEKEWKHKE